MVVQRLTAMQWARRADINPIAAMAAQTAAEEARAQARAQAQAQA
ncbi:hypothetical protein [Kitasatospora sp. NPDC098663]